MGSINVIFFFCMLYIKFNAIISISQKNEVNQHKIVHQINNFATTWTAGHNMAFDKLTVDEAKYKLNGQKIGENDVKSLPIKQFDIQFTEELPINFDLREVYKNCSSLHSILTQNLCSSSWALVITSVISDRICIKSKGKSQLHLSSFNLLTCCVSCGNWCIGGSSIKAWNYLIKNGIVTGGENGCQENKKISKKYFVFNRPLCVNSCSPNSNKIYENDLIFADEIYSISGNNEKEIMRELIEKGSIEAELTVFRDFLNYKIGVYQHVYGEALGRSNVKLIGWGVELGVKYWLLINTFGEAWGVNGAFKIIRGTNHCGIEENLHSGIPKENNLK